jgi:threonine dehydratase
MLDINVTTEVTFEDIRAAAERIRPTAKRTPVMTSRSFDAEAGVAAFFKCENLQTGGAFKIRGASNFIFSIPKDQLEKGVVAHSSGNHAQAVAIAAQYLGTPATLVMPEDAPRAKLEGTRARGARIVAYNRFTDDRTAISARIAAETGATLVPPYDHPWTIAGQGTAAKELLEEVPDLDALVVCVGGGGADVGIVHRRAPHAPVDPDFRNRTGARQRYLFVIRSRKASVHRHAGDHRRRPAVHYAGRVDVSDSAEARRTDADGIG